MCAVTLTPGDTPLLDLPVRGTWKLVKSPGHDRFAFDLLAVDPDSHRPLSKSRLQHLLGRATVGDWYSWLRPIYAPISGTVVRAHNGSPDRRRLSLLHDLWTIFFSRPAAQPADITPFAGNHVIIRGPRSYLFLAHLQHTSLRVSKGEEVEAGQLLARVGNSGFTLEPHLHMQLFDQVDDLDSATAPPFLVAEYERWSGKAWQPLRNATLQKGDLIRASQ